MRCFFMLLAVSLFAFADWESDVHSMKVDMSNMAGYAYETNVEVDYIEDYVKDIRTKILGMADNYWTQANVNYAVNGENGLGNIGCFTYNNSDVIDNSYKHYLLTLYSGGLAQTSNVRSITFEGTNDFMNNWNRAEYLDYMEEYQEANNTSIEDIIGENYVDDGQTDERIYENARVAIDLARQIIDKYNNHITVGGNPPLFTIDLTGLNGMFGQNCTAFDGWSFPVHIVPDETTTPYLYKFWLQWRWLMYDNHLMVVLEVCVVIWMLYEFYCKFLQVFSLE